MTPSPPTRVDMHVKVLDHQVVSRAKARGLDAVVYAPHFVRLPEIRERAAAFGDDELRVIPAREVFTGSWRNRRHVLAVGLDDPVPDFISLEAALEEFRRQGAAVLAPHPTLMNVSVGRRELAAFPDAFDAAETYNAKCLPHQNRRARGLVGDAGLPGFGSSYAHLRRTVGEAWTEFDEPIAEASDLVSLLRAGAPRRVVRQGGIRHHLAGLAEFSHLSYENSWKKVDRLFLSGMEPTHPDHIAYRGRFDDVSVY